MARLYDIAERMKNGSQKPEVKLDEDHVYKINTSKSAVLFIQAIAKDEEKDEMEKVDAMISIALGKDAAEYIDSLDMPMVNINTIVNTIMAAISDVSLEEVEQMEREEAKSKGKKSR